MAPQRKARFLHLCQQPGDKAKQLPRDHHLQLNRCTHLAVLIGVSFFFERCFTGLARSGIVFSEVFFEKLETVCCSRSQILMRPWHREHPSDLQGRGFRRSRTVCKNSLRGLLLAGCGVRAELYTAVRGLFAAKGDAKNG